MQLAEAGSGDLGLRPALDVTIVGGEVSYLRWGSPQRLPRAAVT
ncbi:hypothetical protein [Jatrophihabitans sp. GAS493]|nr:hypothetical protein [Jatrophihabitans sp. GAS493]